MPHLILEGIVDFGQVAEGLSLGVFRWGRAVLKTDQVWRRRDGEAVLVEGVVVEHSRALHPVIQIAPHHDDTILKIWPLASVERTQAVQRLMAEVAADLIRLGAGPLRATNIAPEIWKDLLPKLSDSAG